MHVANSKDTVTQRTRVLIVDDVPANRTLLRHLLIAEYDVVGDAENGAEAVKAVSQMAPDVVVMDYEMPILNGIEATRVIKQLSHPPHIVLYTGEETTLVAPFALAAGVDSVVRKGSSIKILRRAVRDVAHPSRRKQR